MSPWDGADGKGQVPAQPLEAASAFNEANANDESRFRKSKIVLYNDNMQSLFDEDMLATVANDMALSINEMDSDVFFKQMMSNLTSNSTLPPPSNNYITITGKPESVGEPGDGPVPLEGPPRSKAVGQTETSAFGVAEFTKHREWSAKVVGEAQDNLQILDASGRIKYASPSIARIAGYDVNSFKEYFLRDLIHPDDKDLFVSEFNEAIASGSTMRVYYRLKKVDGTYCIIEAVGHAHIAAAKFAPTPNNPSAFCQAFFLIARPYLSQQSRLLDSFLEHKVENERLRRRIAELRREEEEEISRSSYGHPSIYSADKMSEITVSISASDTARNIPARQGTGAACTTDHLANSLSARYEEELYERVARLDGRPLHDEMIEMLTGLQYCEREQRHDIAHGSTSPVPSMGDAGIAMPKDARRRNSKKKLKITEEYICNDCGTLESPEWRMGPAGPKTLCNACGLRWAKNKRVLSKTKDVGPAISSEHASS